MQDRVEQAVRFVRNRWRETPSVGLVLGSGWGGLASLYESKTRVPYADIPGFPRCSVEGHPGILAVHQSWGPLAAVLAGRAHRYEGWSLRDVTFPVRVLAAWGVKILVVTNAAGGLQGVKPGDLALIADHMNLMGENPLTGAGEFPSRFVDMADAYDPGLMALAEEVARREGIIVRRATLAAMGGPSYETRAEAQMLRAMGAHLVCMSTVPEVIVARALGLRVLGLSLVTNMAGTREWAGGTHEAVVAMGQRQAEPMERLLRGIVGALHG